MGAGGGGWDKCAKECTLWQSLGESEHACNALWRANRGLCPNPAASAPCFPPLPLQILCEPAKIVVKKTPGGCTSKYYAASTWTGKASATRANSGIALHGTDTQ